jgi:hypothetical protein
MIEVRINPSRLYEYGSLETNFHYGVEMATDIRLNDITICGVWLRVALEPDAEWPEQFVRNIIITCVSYSIKHAVPLHKNYMEYSPYWLADTSSACKQIARLLWHTRHHYYPYM